MLVVYLVLALALGLLASWEDLVGWWGRASGRSTTRGSKRRAV